MQLHERRINNDKLDLCHAQKFQKFPLFFFFAKKICKYLIVHGHYQMKDCKMKKITYIVVCIMILSCTLFPSTANAQLDEFSEENAYKHIVYLSKEIGIREAGTENALRASEYIKTNFEMYGLETQTQEFEFSYMFGLDKVTKGVPTPDSPPPEMKREGRNVIGILRGASDEEIIICAHYDSREGPGANDDASGVGVLMELAGVFSKEKNYNKTLVFVAFDAEEQLAQGSKHFLSNLNDREIGNIIGVIDLDCVGRGDLLVAYCWEPYPIFFPSFRRECYHTPREFVEIIYNEMGNPPSLIIEQLQAYSFNFQVYAFSDYTTFMSDDFYDEKGIIVPAIEFTFLETGMKRRALTKQQEKYPPIPDLHCMEDTYEKIEAKNLKRVGEIVLNVIQKLDGHERFKNKPETGLIFEVDGKVLNVSYLLILLILFVLPVLTSAIAYMKNKRVVALFLVASPFLLLNLIKSQIPYSPVKVDIPILVMLFSFLFLFGYLHQNKRIGKAFIAGFLSLLLIGSLPFWDQFALNLIGYQIGLLLLSFIIVITVSILRLKSGATLK